MTTCPECHKTHKPNSRALAKCESAAMFNLGLAIIGGYSKTDPVYIAARARAEAFETYEAHLIQETHK